MKHLELIGVNFAETTLHVGLGTFNPIMVEDLSKHIREPSLHVCMPNLDAWVS